MMLDDRTLAEIRGFLEVLPTASEELDDAKEPGRPAERVLEALKIAEALLNRYDAMLVGLSLEQQQEVVSELAWPVTRILGLQKELEERRALLPRSAR